MPNYSEGSTLDRLEKASRALADHIAEYGDIGEAHPSRDELQAALSAFHGRASEPDADTWIEF